MPTKEFLCIVSRSAEFVVLRAALPGRPVRNVGVLLLDHSDKTLYWKLIDDWRTVANAEDAEVLAGVAAYFEERVRETGGERFLQHLEDMSNALLITDRTPIEVSDIQASLDALFRQCVGPDAVSASGERLV